MNKYIFYFLNIIHTNKLKNYNLHISPCIQFWNINANITIYDKNYTSVLSIHTPVALAQHSIRSACAFPHSSSLLKEPTGAESLSASISAPASMDAMTCVAPPAMQPYYSAGENRL